MLKVMSTSCPRICAAPGTPCLLCDRSTALALASGYSPYNAAQTTRQSPSAASQQTQGSKVHTHPHAVAKQRQRHSEHGEKPAKCGCVAHSEHDAAQQHDEGGDAGSRAPAKRVGHPPHRQHPDDDAANLCIRHRLQQFVGARLQLLPAGRVRSLEQACDASTARYILLACMAAAQNSARSTNLVSYRQKTERKPLRTCPGRERSSGHPWRSCWSQCGPR